jgi:GntR family transcriptional regulator of gluconate operon
MGQVTETSKRQVPRVDLGVAVTAEVREMILSGEVRPGDRLVEADLASMFGTSRGPVRDALAELSRGGLVTMLSRRGAYVTLLGPDDIDELYTLRLALETLAVQRAVGRAQPTHITKLHDTLDQIAEAQAAGDSRQVAEADMRFHRTIVGLAGHRRLLTSWEVFADQTLLMMTELNRIRPEVQSRLGGHGELLAAFEAADSARAMSALAAHLNSARESVIERFSALSRSA